MELNMISINHLVKSYGETQVLRDVNAQISKGEIVSLIGPSGTGKSTLLRCMNLIEKPDRGEIIIDGTDITKSGVDIHKMRQRMGMVFQSFNLFSHLMVVENIMLAPVELKKTGRRAAFDKGMELLDTVGLAEKAYAYPNELSGGQKQRVAIARTLAMDPEIILFDEPTSALDPTMVGEVLSVIRSLAKNGMTMVIVTHEMKFARDVSTQIFYMDDGIIYESGSPVQIFDNPQKPKTRAFIHKIMLFEYTIKSKRFDYFGLNTGIEEFGRKQLLSQKQIHALQLVIEELIIETILKAVETEVKFSIGYFEEKDEIEIAACYGGNPFNPLEKSDELSMAILNNLTKSLEYTYDGGINKMTAIL